MFSGSNLRRQADEQESQGEKNDAAVSAHENRSRAPMSPAVFDKMRDYLRKGRMELNGISDIEGKAVRVAASDSGSQTSFNKHK